MNLSDKINNKFWDFAEPVNNFLTKTTVGKVLSWIMVGVIIALMFAELLVYLSALWT